MAPLLDTTEQVTRSGELLAVKAHSDNGKVITGSKSLAMSLFDQFAERVRP